MLALHKIMHVMGLLSMSTSLLPLHLAIQILFCGECRDHSLQASSRQTSHVEQADWNACQDTGHPTEEIW